jgi:hypothetical protein
MNILVKYERMGSTTNKNRGNIVCTESGTIAYSKGKLIAMNTACATENDARTVKSAVEGLSAI